MRRLAGGALVALALLAVGVLGGCAGSGGGGYRVRAIFDSAANVISGEDVRIAGVNVGKVQSLDLTPDQKAVVVLSITNPGFQDFRSDASCTIRPQSLIGEKFVECLPTQPRTVGTSQAPPLATVPAGQPGAGEHLVPLAQTSSPVDIDLVGDVLRLPYRERLTLIVNELGAGLAGRGEELRQVVLRADPALQQADRVLAILAGENRTLAQLASDSDRVLAPLARQRAHVADAITQTGRVATATAEQRGALARSLADLPGFLAQLGPTMQRLGALADQATPTLSSLLTAAPALNQVSASLAPFARGAQPFLRTLGTASAGAIPSVIASQPLAVHLGNAGAAVQPLGVKLASLLGSLRDTGGIERLLDFVYRGAAATNGYDTSGHYLRSALVVNACSPYATTPATGCSANFIPSGNGKASTAAVRALGSPAASALGSPAQANTTKSLLDYLLGPPAAGAAGGLR